MNYKQVMSKGSRISDSGIDKWHDFTDNDRQLCESNTQGIYYVIARDKFMSGWGGAEGRISYFVEVCWSSMQANYAEDAIRKANEMRNVRVVSKLPTRLNGHVSVYNFDYSARFNKEYFWNISKGYEKDNDIVPHDSDKTKKNNVSDSKKIKDGVDELNNYRSPEDIKHDEAWNKLESFAQTFEPTILNEEWKDEENCVVTLGDKNSSVQLIVNCYGTYDEGLKDFAIVNDYEGYGMPDDNFFMANAIRNKATHDDELGDKLFYDIYYYLSENLSFGSNDSDEISDSRRVSDSDIINTKKRGASDIAKFRHFEDIDGNCYYNVGASYDAKLDMDKGVAYPITSKQYKSVNLPTINDLIESGELVEVNDSRVSDSEGSYKKYMATVQVDLDKDEQGGYDDTYISETTGKTYTSDDFMNGVLVKEGDFCDTYDDAYNQAVDLCFEFVNNGFKNDGYFVSIEEFIVDETTGEIIESEEYNRYNAWYSRGEIIMA